MTSAGTSRWLRGLCVTVAALLATACGAEEAPPAHAAGAGGHDGTTAAERLAPLPGPVALATPTPSPPAPASAPRAATTPSTPAPPSDAAAPSTPAPQAALEELRATDRFLELAPHDRAVDARWARFAWTVFAPHAADEKLFEWTNKAALWDEVVPPLRDACLLAGPEATRPMWDAEVLIAAGGSPAWNDDTTGGRGQFVEFSCVYDDTGEPVERFFGVLITTADDLNGRVRARMPSFDVREADYPDFAASRAGIDADLWAWVQAQPPVDTDPPGTDRASPDAAGAP